MTPYRPIYIYTSSTSVNVVIVNSARLFFFQIIKEGFRLPPSSEMHIGLPTDWGEYVDFEEINQAL